MAPHYEVFHGGDRILTFSAEAGALLSTAARPPGFRPPAHPFVNAQAHDAGFEDRLSELLRQAKSAAEFVASLQNDGFLVKEIHEILGRSE